MAYLVISIRKQLISLYRDGDLHKHYPIATALNGIGQQQNSGQTPLGLHRIAALYGEGCDPYTYFKARRPQGVVKNSDDFVAQPDRDWILSRILWLSGLEDGFNRGYGCDSMARYIYIHGAPEYKLNQPQSKGCINMLPSDIIELYNFCFIGMRVNIEH